MAVTGLARPLRAAMTTRQLTSRGDGESPVAALSADYFWGTPPTPVTDIPYAWLRRPHAFRPQPPMNNVTVSRTNSGQVRAVNQASIDARGNQPASYTIDTVLADDSVNLARWTAATFDAARVRCPSVTIEVTYNIAGGLTDLERQRVLRLDIGDRIRIPDAPASWPAGTSQLQITGVRHSIGDEQHLLTWTTAALIGAEPGEVGPWWRLDYSPLDSTDTIPY